jgi:DNA primase
LAQLDLIKAQVLTRLSDYLSRFVQFKHGQNFSCISPTHADHDPSCGVVRQNPELFHCFSCGVVGDIFVAANMLEGKPLRGPGFLTDNLFYLAKSFGMEVPHVELTPDEQHDVDTYRAYAMASQVIVASPKSDRVQAKLLEYGWSEKTMRDLGIGSVASFEQFMEQMTKTFGFNRQFLRNVDLDNKRMFNADCLIFTVCDEHGQPVGFASRNLLYNSLREDFDRVIAEYGVDSQEAKDAKAKLPPKFVNTEQAQGDETGLKNRIYQKSKRLFGFHKARHNMPPLYIFEGYADCATAYNAGLHNGCAIGATAFTNGHYDMLMECGVDHVICNLDADEAGEKGIDRFIEIVKEHTQSGLKVQILELPSGEDDPDCFIRKHGLGMFLDVQSTDIFAWELKRSIAAGEHPDKAFDRIVPLIGNEPHSLRRQRMAESLSAATGIASEVIWAEVQRLVDKEASRINVEMGMVASRTAKMLERNPDKIQEILYDSTRAVERINVMRQGYDLGRLLKYVDDIMDDAEAHTADGGLKLGWPLFDTTFGGIPESDAFISIPGKPSQGKSSWLCNVAWRLVDYNSDPIVLYHTVDDAMRWFLPRLLGSKYRVASECFYRSGKYLADNTLVRVNGGEDKRPFREVHAEAKKWLRGMIQGERLLPYDASMLDQNVFSLEMRVRDLRKKYPSRPIVVFGDNFHLYTNPAMKEEGEARTRSMSMACKNLANVHHITLIMTMELPKSALAEGVRPRMMNIKGSAGISYDASANIGIYNDKKDLRERSELVWEEDVESFEVSAGQVCSKMTHPVLEMVFDKSKINTGFDGNIYYYFHPPSAQVQECVPDDQVKYAALAAKQQQQRRNQIAQGARFGYDAVPESLHDQVAKLPPMSGAETVAFFAG